MYFILFHSQTFNWIFTSVKNFSCSSLPSGTPVLKYVVQAVHKDNPEAANGLSNLFISV